MATRPEDVEAIARAAGLRLEPDRCVAVARAIDAYGPLLDSVEAVDLDDGSPPPTVFDPRW